MSGGEAHYYSWRHLEARRKERCDAATAAAAATTTTTTPDSVQSVAEEMNRMTIAGSAAEETDRTTIAELYKDKIYYRERTLAIAAELKEAPAYNPFVHESSKDAHK